MKNKLFVSFVEHLNSTIRWSNLSKFGTSTYGRITVLAPVVGFLIFRNDALTDYLELVPEQSRLTWHAHLSSLRLELFYLGLVLIGVSVGLFTIFAPQQIKDHTLYSSFMKVKIETSTPEALQFSFDKTIGLYSSKLAGRRNFGQFRSVMLPLHYDDSYRKLLVRLLESSNRQPEAQSVPSSSTVDVSGFRQRLKERDLSRSDIAVLRTRLLEYGSDIYRFEYIFAEYLGFKRRLLVFTSFIFGTIVTVLPTFLTTTSIFSKVLFDTSVT